MASVRVVCSQRSPLFCCYFRPCSSSTSRQLSLLLPCRQADSPPGLHPAPFPVDMFPRLAGVFIYRLVITLSSNGFILRLLPAASPDVLLPRFTPAPCNNAVSQRGLTGLVLNTRQPPTVVFRWFLHLLRSVVSEHVVLRLVFRRLPLFSCLSCRTAAASSCVFSGAFGLRLPKDVASPLAALKCRVRTNRIACRD